MSTDVEAILKATIQAKVIEAFNQTPDMVEKMVAAAFSKEVDEDGHTPSSRSWNASKMPWIDWLVGEEIRKAAREAVQDYMTEHRDTVKAKVIAAINAGDFGAQIGDKIAEMMADEYRWTFSITKGRRD